MDTFRGWRRKDSTSEHTAVNGVQNPKWEEVIQKQNSGGNRISIISFVDYRVSLEMILGYVT